MAKHYGTNNRNVYETDKKESKNIFFTSD